MEDLVLLKYPNYLRQSNRFKAIPIKIPMAFYFYRNGKKKAKINVEPQRTPNKQNSLETEQSWKHHILHFKAYYKDKAIKEV